ncbi:hypothetical protein FQA39_LY10658 [Lamprigera yunnana]|nr:hypothetical protein FQA39_LY10658 [Lamprigera yunnana]
MPNDTSHVPEALTSDEAGHLILTPVRKTRLSKSKQKLRQEAARVLQEVDRVNCYAKNEANSKKFYTLPARRKYKTNSDSPQSSLDRTTRRRDSADLESPGNNPPKKPPRTFVHYSRPEKTRSSIFNIFKKPDKESPQKSNLRRSVSDATNLKSKVQNFYNDNSNTLQTEKDAEDNLYDLKNGKKQLSPIIEDNQANDYFSRSNKESIKLEQKKEDVENLLQIERNRNPKVKQQSITEKLKEYIDDIDTALLSETETRFDNSHNKKLPEIVVIDVDKAEKITKKKERSKLNAVVIGKKIKSLSHKSKKSPVIERNKNHFKINSSEKNTPQSRKVKETIINLQSQSDNRKSTMIHSSQKPADKLPLTRGLTVGTMVKRLSNDKSSCSPPKTNIMVTPTITVQHNNNQPFSYTRGHSPDRNYRSPDEIDSPVIYAHVVCDKRGQNNTPTVKQTVHAVYSNGKKHLPHSDSDEGLGNEENSGFSRKYESEKTVTHFGDNYLSENRYDDEISITPKIKNGRYNNYKEHNKTDYNIFVDSSSRGRGDGMDSKRRESLTEPMESGLNSLKFNSNTSRTDLSARRDLLESRINRRLEEKHVRQSPSCNVNKYVAETKYYRHGSNSPVGYFETYSNEAKTDKNGNRQITESRTRKEISDHERTTYRYKYENEPKSFERQLSDYRSSAENVAHRNDMGDYRYSHSNKYASREVRQKLNKDREHYKSNPEIIQKNYDYDDYHETYHDSLKRDKHEGKTSIPKNRSDKKYFYRADFDRKDRLGDSGIENDFKRDSRENFKTPRNFTKKRDYCNESEDEGFASSLLIASERQHTENNINSRKIKNEYESDRSYREDPYRNNVKIDYRTLREYNYKDNKHEFAPRERSIDDGSHYDPRIDKNFDTERNTLKKVIDKKPPKLEKMSGLEKVKQLFTRDANKKKEKDRNRIAEENFRARYAEQSVSREHLDPGTIKKNVADVKSGHDYSNRRRLSTPSASPTREVPRNLKSEGTHGSWFKSLDRLSRKKSKKDDKEISNEQDIIEKPAPTKSLRFFGDTDVESNDSLRHKSTKTRSSLSNSNHLDQFRNQSTKDSQNIFEKRQSPEFNTTLKSSNHKSLLNISDSNARNSYLAVKPPISPNHRPNKDFQPGKDDRGRRKRNEVSSVESSTEGDSSQQSQRSVVYLHAATVGDIPGPGYLKNGRRASSREELVSNGSSNVKPQMKTLSRSFSVLAPWKPRHNKETYDIDYTQYPKPTKNGKYEQKVSRNSNSRKDSSSTLKKKANETKRTNQSMSTLSKRSRSKENIKKSNEDLSKGSSSTLYKKKGRQSKENIRYTKDKDDKKIFSKSVSVESLGNCRGYKENPRDVSRSVSMPRDAEKTAGWFKMNKKSKKSLSTQRL